ncbi:hypothetical protein OIE68_00910 [Nocardia vinacea]|uniref:hypothetical protein n=1 Tax=Nocardia vinacea TaxID=96468 RepID=UPI002E11169B|nr:hypothetical protein OIE68_00910 [Nocardia vinacea]
MLCNRAVIALANAVTAPRVTIVMARIREIREDVPGLFPVLMRCARLILVTALISLIGTVYLLAVSLVWLAQKVDYVAPLVAAVVTTVALALVFIQVVAAEAFLVFSPWATTADLLATSRLQSTDEPPTSSGE